MALVHLPFTIDFRFCFIRVPEEHVPPCHYRAEPFDCAIVIFFKRSKV